MTDDNAELRQLLTEAIASLDAHRRVIELLETEQTGLRNVHRRELEAARSRSARVSALPRARFEDSAREAFLLAQNGELTQRLELANATIERLERKLFLAESKCIR